MKFKLNPIHQTALFLAIYTTAALYFNDFKETIIWHLGATLGFALILFGAYSKGFKKRKILWNTIISALILFLVLHYSTAEIVSSDFSTLKPLLYPLIATFFIITWKFFGEWKGSPIINPIAFGLLSLAALSILIGSLDKPFISWWGASFQGNISLGLMIAWIILGLRKWRKYYAFLSFLIGYALFRFLLGTELATLEFIFTDATIYFFAGIMLIEPKTSPTKKSHQIVYGMCAALLMGLLQFYGIPYFELIALAGANILNIGFKLWMTRPKPQSA